MRCGPGDQCTYCLSFGDAAAGSRNSSLRPRLRQRDVDLSVCHPDCQGIAHPAACDCPVPSTRSIPGPFSCISEQPKEGPRIPVL